MGKERIAAAKRKAAKLKAIKLKEKRAKAKEKARKLTQTKEKRFKRAFKLKQRAARMKHYPKKTSRGWKASFWLNTRNCKNVAHCDSKTKNRRADKVITVSQINYRSTGGKWPGLDRAFRDHYTARFTGWVKIPRAGKYTF